MKLNRRTFFKVAGAASTFAFGSASQARAGAAPAAAVDSSAALLIDTTRCVGCRTCEAACAQANGLPDPDPSDTVFEHRRTTSETQYTAVDRRRTSAGDVFVKRQCLHCLTPACASACLTKAMLKTPEGPVIWRAEKCMGCRFCMVSCPMDIPKFEYGSAVPEIRKCQLCHERLVAGGRPACVENCPAEALQFGTRAQMLSEARRRMAAEPGRYIEEIFGELDAGGTSVLYLSAVPFTELGFRGDLGSAPFPELTKEFLYAVPVVLTVLPALLLGISNATRRTDESAAQGALDEHALTHVDDVA
jgi:Fe-S-cluster-containing dehydrogenase component